MARACSFALLAAAVPMLLAQSTVEGVVTNGVTGAPVRKAQVLLRSGPSPYGAVSDSSGRFQIFDVPAGEYYAAASCQGYSTSSAKSVSVKGPVTVNLQLLPFGAISGKVLDEDGEPLPAAVNAMQYDYNRPGAPLVVRKTVPVDDRGQYRIFDLAPGRFYVQAAPILAYGVPPAVVRALQLPEGIYPVLHYPNALDPADASPIDVRPGGDIGGIDFRIRRTPRFHIRGIATDAESGQPLNAVIVAVACGNESIRHSTSLEANGRFDVAVQPGSYCLSVEQNRGSVALFARRTVTVADRDVEGVQLTAAPSFELSGTVTVEGPPPVESRLPIQVTLDPLQAGESSANAYARDGAFEFRSVAPSLHAVFVRPLSPGYYLKSIRFGERDASDGIIDASQSHGPLSLVLAPGAGEVQGSARTPDGPPAAGAIVVVAPAGGLSERRDLLQSMAVGTDGSFRIISLAPGDYRAFALEGVDSSIARSAAFRRLVDGKATAFTIHQGGPETIQLVTLPASTIEEARARMR